MGPLAQRRNTRSEGDEDELTDDEVYLARHGPLERAEGLKYNIGLDKKDQIDLTTDKSPSLA